MLFQKGNNKINPLGALVIIPVVFAVVISGCKSQKDIIAKNPLIENTPEATIQPTYLSIRENIFSLTSPRGKCVSCHGSINPAHHLDLSSYEKMATGKHLPPLIVPGDPEESSLYIECATGKMPKGGPKLTQAELNALYDWIKDGARDEAGVAMPNPDNGIPGEGDDEGDHDDDGDDGDHGGHHDHQ